MVEIEAVDAPVLESGFESQERTTSADGVSGSNGSGRGYDGRDVSSRYETVDEMNPLISELDWGDGKVT